MDKFTPQELKEWLINKAAETKGRTISTRAVKQMDADANKRFSELSHSITGDITRKAVVNFTNRKQDRTIIGKMYFYKYDPKFKHMLPKYDMFPMCIPIQMYDNGFLGLNLHYLNIYQRDAFVNLLLKNLKKNRYDDERGKLNISYDIIKESKKFNALGIPCVHRYLWSHCRSKFVEIYQNEYDKAIMLPTEDWVFNQ